MKLLLISPLPPPLGGIATWTEKYCELCVANGVNIDVVNTGMIGDRLQNSTAKRNFKDELVRTKRIFDDLKAQLNDKDATYDVVHLNTSCGTFGLFRDYLIAKKVKAKKLKLVTHYHCDIPYWIGNPLSRIYLKKLAKLSDANLVLCENSREYLGKQVGVSSIKVPNFIDEDAILCGEKSISDQIKRVFFVGRVSDAKGARELYALAEKFPQIEFQLAGVVDEEVSKRKKPDNLELIGAVPHKDIASYMDKADVFVFPTYSEGFSIALLEAMARGLPVITTDVGANLDMIEQSGGMVVELGDLDGMIKAVEIMSDPAIRAEMSKWNLEKVKNSYAKNMALKQFLTIYNEL